MYTSVGDISQTSFLTSLELIRSYACVYVYEVAALI